MRKDYLAVCAGRAPSDVFSIDLPIVTTSRVQRCAPEGRRAIRVRQGTLRYNLGYSGVYCRVYSRILDAPQRVGARPPPTDSRAGKCHLMRSCGRLHVLAAVRRMGHAGDEAVTHVAVLASGRVPGAGSAGGGDVCLVRVHRPPCTHALWWAVRWSAGCAGGYPA